MQSLNDGNVSLVIGAVIRGRVTAPWGGVGAAGRSDGVQGPRHEDVPAGASGVQVAYLTSSVTSQLPHQ